MILEVSYRKKSGKRTNMWRLNNLVLQNQWVRIWCRRQRIRRENQNRLSQKVERPAQIQRLSRGQDPAFRFLSPITCLGIFLEWSSEPLGWFSVIQQERFLLPPCFRAALVQSHLAVISWCHYCSVICLLLDTSPRRWGMRLCSWQPSPQRLVQILTRSGWSRNIARII